MNEGSFDDGNYLVRVRAQVMKRDDSTGGWLPMGGGGLSNVSVRKRFTEEDPNHEYLIFGKHLCDSNVVLACPIRKDFQYHKVMPTFHHWRTGDKKFGLTFQTASDARAFDKGIRRAVEDLLEGTGETPLFADTDMGDDDVFMTLELPVDSRSSSGSSSTSNGGRHSSNPLNPAFHSDFYNGGGLMSNTTLSPYTHPHSNHHHLHRMHFIRPPNVAKGSVTAPAQNHEHHVQDVWNQRLKRDPNDKIEIMPGGDSYSYVQFAKDKPSRPESHDYSYPVMDAFKKQPSFDSLKKQPYRHPVQLQQPPLLPTKKKKLKMRKLKDGSGAKLQCRHCLEMFNEDENYRGSCEYAPDGVIACINATSCISCARCMLYHCMSDSEGDYEHHPCTCEASAVDRNKDRSFRKRWIGLTLLSLFVPCLWCYLPLRACHRCGVACKLCGGKHDPV